MADAVGLVASVITLSEVTNKIIVLRDLWRQFKNVPHSIQNQLDQLEALNAVMAKVEAQAKSNTDLGIGTGVLGVRHCKQAALELDKVIQELQRRIQSTKLLQRTMAKFKAVLEQESISRAQRHLQEALQIMQLALTLHTCSLIEVVPERTAAIVFARQTESNPPATSCQTGSTLAQRKEQDANSTTRQVNRPLPWLSKSVFGSITANRHAVIQQEANFDTGGRQIAQARIILPSWLSSKVWDVLAYRSVHGFMWKLSSWNLCPRDSLIFDAVENGSISDLTEILSSGKGSLYDRTSNGMTLLHLAAENNRFDMAKSLIKMGIPILEQTVQGYFPFEMASRLQSGLFTVGQPLDLFTSAIDIGDFRQDYALLYGQIPRTGSKYSIFSKYIWSVPGLLKHIDNEMTTKFTRLPIGLKLAWLDWMYVDPSVLNTIMTENHITFDDIRLHMDNSFICSLHAFVFAYFLCAFRFSLYGFEPDEGLCTSKSQEWNELAQCVLSGMSLSYLSNAIRLKYKCNYSGKPFYLTPLLYGVMYQMSVISWYPTYLFGRNRRRKLLKMHFDAVRDFLNVVSKSKIDLREYGRKEVATFQNNKGIFANRCSTLFPRAPAFQALGDGPYLVSISYGPTPIDWTFRWDNLVEEFAGEFWQMLERESCKVPGAWVD